jgi:hypothetical protein
MASGTARHANHDTNHYSSVNTTSQPSRGSPDPVTTCPACGAKGHGRLTADRAVSLLFLAVALQIGIAVIVPHPRIRDAPLITPAREHFPPHTRFAALGVGNLVRAHVSGFIKISPADPLSAKAANAVVEPMRGHAREARGESAGDALRAVRMEV